MWDALLEKRCGIARTTAFDPARFDAQISGQIHDLKVRDFVPKSYRKSIKVMSRDIEVAVAAAYEAVKDAGLRTKCLIELGEALPALCDAFVTAALNGEPADRRAALRGRIATESVDPLRQKLATVARADDDAISTTMVGMLRTQERDRALAEIFQRASIRFRLS